MKNKGMLVILIIMFVIAVTGGIIGFLESKKNGQKCWLKD